MRTTITLDEDVARAVEAERARTGETFRQAINRLVRRGLQRPPMRDRLPLPLLPGRLRVDITDTSAVLADLDVERDRDRGLQ